MTSWVFVMVETVRDIRYTGIRPLTHPGSALSYCTVWIRMPCVNSHATCSHSRLEHITSITQRPLRLSKSDQPHAASQPLAGAAARTLG